jgi:hypothetical protein
MITLLIKLLPYIAPALRFADNQNRNYYKVHLLLYAVLVWVVDIVLAHSIMVFVFGFPQGKELTISDTLERLSVTTSQKQQKALLLGRAINQVSPGHIKALA